MPHLAYTDHGWQRKNERCKGDLLVDLLLEHFDRDVYVGSGDYAWSISRRRCMELRRAGVISASQADGLAKLILVMTEDERVKTLIKGGKALGRYFTRH
ncbi:MAG TPA: hypothetical protein PK264_01815 [Hyphomicrobiaceae bacterium]|nr:hypothetical protein [Hyphomicrobiaceae bacterium]